MNENCDFTKIERFSASEIYPRKELGNRISCFLIGLFLPCLILAIGAQNVKSQPVVSSEDRRSVAESIVVAAKESVGKEMWKNGFGLKDGRLGCAASLSNVLKKGGVKGVGSPVTLYLRKQLLDGPYTAREFTIKSGGDSAIADKIVLERARPGDVLLAFMDPLPKGNIGPKAHCGIIGPDATVFTNDWNDGIWKQSNIHAYFDHYRHISVIRLVDKTNR